MILGIDLGTTYSVCSYLDTNGEPQAIVNTEGSRTTPSVVYFESESSIIVGQTAKENSITFPDDVVSAVKNHMGTKKIFTSSYGNEYTPEVISGFILKKLVADANRFLNPEKQVNEVTKEERQKLIKLLKQFEITIKGFRPIEDAIITSGGINIKEVNPKTMESKLIKGLYFAGEILDVDAYTGGFNLQIAYSTGFIAGQ